MELNKLYKTICYMSLMPHECIYQQTCTYCKIDCKSTQIHDGELVVLIDVTVNGRLVLYKGSLFTCVMSRSLEEIIEPV